MRHGITPLPGTWGTRATGCCSSATVRQRARPPVVAVGRILEPAATMPVEPRTRPEPCAGQLFQELQGPGLVRRRLAPSSTSRSWPTRTRRVRGLASGGRSQGGGYLSRISSGTAPSSSAKTCSATTRNGSVEDAPGGRRRTTGCSGSSSSIPLTRQDAAEERRGIQPAELAILEGQAGEAASPRDARSPRHRHQPVFAVRDRRLRVTVRGTVGIDRPCSASRSSRPEPAYHRRGFTIDS